ncbi:MAG TPA: DUF305 domain-containing protein, partial [Pyrinomonadaceae bacterium]
MLINSSPLKCFAEGRNRFFAAAIFVCLFSLSIAAQRSKPDKPVIVQPGAPGQPTRTLPSSTRAKLPPYTVADAQFMQHMIIHHAQAVEMAALIEAHTENKEIRSLGARISKSQDDEIKFMKRWLAARGQPISAASTSAHQMHGSDTSHHEMLMPGMLTAKQMDALKNAKGEEFDRLFLTGMI